MSSPIEQLFIKKFLSKVINCYCKECVEQVRGRVDVPVAPQQIQFTDMIVPSCPCEECLHSYPKNTTELIKFEEPTTCEQPTRCYDCLEHYTMCLELEVAKKDRLLAEIAEQKEVAVTKTLEVSKVATNEDPFAIMFRKGIFIGLCD